MYDVITTHDVSFFATAASEPIVTRAGLVPAIDAAQRRTALVLIDICVPRNVDAEVGLVSNTLSYNVDRLKDVVARNTEARRGEIIKAEDILENDKKHWLDWHTSLAAVPTLKRLREQAEQVRKQELQKHAYSISQLPKKQQQTIDRFTEGLVKSLMHQPMTELNKPQQADEQQRTIGEFNRLFDLYGGREGSRKDEAVKLLEVLAEDMKENAANIQVAAAEKPDLATRNLATAPEDIKNARRRERLAEVRIIQKVACGITQATLQALEVMQERADRVRIGNRETSVKPLLLKRGLGREGQAEAQALDGITQSMAEVTINTVSKLQERAEMIRRQELLKQRKYLKSLTQTEAELVEKISHGIVNTLMAGPTSHLTSAEAVDEKSRTLSKFASLFCIPALNIPKVAVQAVDREIPT
jgi:hypothetical protein